MSLAHIGRPIDCFVPSPPENTSFRQLEVGASDQLPSLILRKHGLFLCKDTRNRHIVYPKLMTDFSDRF